MEFLQEPTAKIAEVITGILSSETKDWKLSAGKLVQATIKGNLLTQLGREIKKYQTEGIIKEDYFATHKTRVSLYELLKFLDEEIPDEELFRAIKSIFFSGISIKATEQDEALSYEFLQTAKQLSGTEILILKANFDIAEGRASDDVEIRLRQLNLPYMRSSWRQIISVQMRYGEFDSVVSKYEINLEMSGLISRRQEDNRFSGDFEPTKKFRLTEFGYKFCQFMTNYE